MIKTPLENDGDAAVPDDACEFDRDRLLCSLDELISLQQHRIVRRRRKADKFAQKAGKRIKEVDRRVLLAYGHLEALREIHSYVSAKMPPTGSGAVARESLSSENGSSSAE